MSTHTPNSPKIIRYCPLIVGLLLLGCLPLTQSIRPTDHHQPSLRLTGDIKPLEYRLDLELSPDTDTYQGRVEIDLVVQSTTRRIVLHAEKLEIRTVLHSDVLGYLSPEFDIQDDKLIVEYPRQLPLGNATLRFHFEGKISEVPNALYRVNDGQHKYLFTQFEPIAARKVFPCFDEPKYKTPFEVSISVPNGVDAVANAPLRVVDTAGTRKVFRFKPTRPLPTYLVAFGVGPFDFVDGGKIGAEGTPFRIVVPKGKSARSAFARGNPKDFEFLRGLSRCPIPVSKT